MKVRRSRFGSFDPYPAQVIAIPRISVFQCGIWVQSAIFSLASRSQAGYDGRKSFGIYAWFKIILNAFKFLENSRWPTLTCALF